MEGKEAVSPSAPSSSIQPDKPQQQRKTMPAEKATTQGPAENDTEREKHSPAAEVFPVTSTASEKEKPLPQNNVVALRPARQQVASPTDAIPDAGLKDKKAAPPPAPDIRPLQTPQPSPASPPLPSKENMEGAFNPLDRLNRLRQQPPSGQNTGTEETESGGETQELKMQVTELADGGLQVTTAGKTPSAQENPDGRKTNRRMADEEENILRHRHKDDPGYSEMDMDRYEDDGEHEL